MSWTFPEIPWNLTETPLWSLINFLIIPRKLLTSMKITFVIPCSAWNPLEITLLLIWYPWYPWNLPVSLEAFLSVQKPLWATKTSWSSTLKPAVALHIQKPPNPPWRALKPPEAPETAPWNPLKPPWKPDVLLAHASQLLFLRHTRPWQTRLSRKSGPATRLSTVKTGFRK